MAAPDAGHARPRCVMTFWVFLQLVCIKKGSHQIRMSPFHLLELEDDVLQCILLALPKGEQDVVFVALACKRLLEVIRATLREAVRKHREEQHLLPPSDAELAECKLRTAITGVFLSPERVAYCHAHRITLQMHGILGRRAGPHQPHGLHTPELPTATIWYIAKGAPCAYIMQLFASDPDVSIFDTAIMLADDEALLIFLAANGRTDVLYALAERYDVLDSELFSTSAIIPFLAASQGPSSRGRRPVDTLLRILVDPAIRFNQSSVLEWVSQTAVAKARKEKLLLAPNYVTFAGYHIVQQSLHDTVHGPVLGVLRRMVIHAARAGNADVYETALAHIGYMWHRLGPPRPGTNIDNRRWVRAWCWLLLSWTFGKRYGRGKVASLLSNWCRSERAMLCEMFNLPPEAPFDLWSLSEMDHFGNPFAGMPETEGNGMAPHRAFIVGDEAYSHWLMHELWDRNPKNERFLARGNPSGQFEDHDQPYAIVADCRRLLGAYPTPEAPHTVRSTPLVIPRHMVSGEGYARTLPVEMLDRYSTAHWLENDGPVGLWDTECAPRERDKEIAVLLDRWLREGLKMGFGRTVDQKWCRALRCAPAAMVPMLERLIEDTQDDPEKRRVIGVHVLVSLEQSFSWLGDYCELGMSTCVVLCYKHGLFTRDDFVESVEQYTSGGADPSYSERTSRVLETLHAWFDKIDARRAQFETCA